MPCPGSACFALANCLLPFGLLSLPPPTVLSMIAMIIDCIIDGLVEISTQLCSHLGLPHQHCRPGCKADWGRLADLRRATLPSPPISLARSPAVWMLNSQMAPQPYQAIYDGARRV